MIKKIVQHDRPNCIGCAACAAIDPKTWVMNGDGKADLINSEKFNEGWQRKDVKEEEFQNNMDAADSCPVNVIHIVEEEYDKNNKKINEKKLK